MNRILAVISITLAVPCFVYMFNQDMYVVCGTGVITLALVLAGFWAENFIRTSGGQFLNRVIYHFTRNEKNFNILSKRFTYIYLPNNEYRVEKCIEISPMSNSLENIVESFSWSAPSAGVKIEPYNKQNEINKVWQQEKWTCCSVYFNENCKKKVPYTTGIVLSNLVDTGGYAVPYIGSNVTKKTKQLTLVIKIPKSMNPHDAQLKVYSAKNISEEIETEDLEYNETVMGYTKTIDYPRKGWRYVISWRI